MTSDRNSPCEAMPHYQQVDVRPALDGFRDMADRLVQMPLARLTGKSDFVPLSLWPSPTMKARVSKHAIFLVSLVLVVVNAPFDFSCGTNLMCCVVWRVGISCVGC